MKSEKAVIALYYLFMREMIDSEDFEYLIGRHYKKIVEEYLAANN